MIGLFKLPLMTKKMPLVFVEQFKARVAADSGIFVAESCLEGTYIDFLILSFKARVLQDSGTFVAKSCLKDTLTVLINND